MELTIDQELLIQGILYLTVGVAVAAAGIFLAAWFIMKVLGIKEFQKKLSEGNIAVAILGTSAIVAIALIMGKAVGVIFDLVALISQSPNIENIAKVLGYSVGYIIVALLVGGMVLGMGAKIFTRMTKDINEIEAIENNNIAAALVLGAVFLVLALMALPGLGATLEGLLPLPELPKNQILNIH